MIEHLREPTKLRAILMQPMVPAQEEGVVAEAEVIKAELQDVETLAEVAVAMKMVLPNHLQIIKKQR